MPFKESKDGQTHYCNHENKNPSGICDKCLGKAIVKEAKTFSKELVLIRAFAILMKDKSGQVIYTFDSKKKADEFYNVLKSNV
jgi:hypothetical protein